MLSQQRKQILRTNTRLCMSLLNVISAATGAKFTAGVAGLSAYCLKIHYCLSKISVKINGMQTPHFLRL